MGSSSARTALIRLFVLFYVTAALALAAVIFVVAAGDAERQRVSLRAQEAAKVNVAAAAIAHRVASLSSDLLVLAHSPAVKRYGTYGTAGEKQRMTELFTVFSGEKRIYDQIRYLDVRGMEIVRVNLVGGKPDVVPSARLQDKGRRYFFLDALRLNDGEVYVSPLDLNIEQGVVETPYKPMLRLGTPVFDLAGHKRGVVILNFLARNLLDDFRAAMGPGAEAQLLNRDGHWLAAPDADVEWGFMFGRSGTFATRYPLEWSRFLAEGNGYVETENGLFAFRVVYPLSTGQRSSTGSANAAGGSAREISDREYFWVAVSRVPPSLVPAISVDRHPLAVLGFVLGFAGLAVLCGLLAAAIVSRRELRRAIYENERNLREMTGALGVGVYVVDAEGYVAYANPEAGRLLGWRIEELVGREAHATFHHHEPGGRWLGAAQCRLITAMKAGQSYRSDDEMFWSRDGTALPVEASCHPLRQQDGRFGQVVAFQDVSARKQDEEAVRRMAFYDALTGLPNRRLLVDLLTQALAQAAHHGRTLAVMFVDLDNFKRINDALGHHVGDELLKAVSERLRECVRAGDTVSRQGGDEFVVLLPEIARVEDVSVVAEKMVEALRRPITVAGHEIEVTMSVGIAVFPLAVAADATELIKQADIAMYEAKAAGKNTFRLVRNATSSVAGAE